MDFTSNEFAVALYLYDDCILQMQINISHQLIGNCFIELIKDNNIDSFV